MISNTKFTTYLDNGLQDHFQDLDWDGPYNCWEAPYKHWEALGPYSHIEELDELKIIK